MQPTYSLKITQDLLDDIGFTEGSAREVITAYKCGSERLYNGVVHKLKRFYKYTPRSEHMAFINKHAY